MGIGEDPRYVRPALPTSTYYSSEGEPIPYGQRWGEDGPPEDAYSVLNHPERFAALHDVAHALIAHLTATFDVEVDDNQSTINDLLRQPEAVVESVRVTPRKAGTASLTFVLTQPPGVIVHAGVLHDFAFPPCSCDACDETAESAADRLELLVLAVTAGGYSERYPVGWRRWLGYGLTAADGSAEESGQGDPGSIVPDRLRSAKARLRDVPNGWLPWPPGEHRQ
ncbi:DUF6226 family protein [Arthrobacter sp. NPDC058097]|uniref:DUF6226 family protein n=1 Tax=Arthrobacter sp. NPDC058097 TaxID=3346340 RepID=UPI0036D94AB4